MQLIWNDGQQHEGNSNNIIYPVANNVDDGWSESSTFLDDDDDDHSVQSIDLILGGTDQEEFPTHHTKIGMCPYMLNLDDSDSLIKLITNTAPIKEDDQVDGGDISIIITKRDHTDLTLHAMKLDQLSRKEVENEDFEIIFDDDDHMPTQLRVRLQQNTNY